MKSGIYLITNLINFKIYIGKSNNILNRFTSHKSDARRNPIQLISKAIAKYGVCNFNFEILELCPINYLNEREKYWIFAYHANNKTVGYNLTSGGEGLSNASEETRKKLGTISSKRNSGKGNPRFGKPATEFCKQQTRNAKAKYYKIIYPDNTEKIIFSLNKFCKDNNLSQSHMHETCYFKYKYYKGWRAEFSPS